MWNDSLDGQYLWSNVNFGEAMAGVITYSIQTRLLANPNIILLTGVAQRTLCENRAKTQLPCCSTQT